MSAIRRELETEADGIFLGVEIEGDICRAFAEWCERRILAEREACLTDIEMAATAEEAAAAIRARG